MQNETELAVQFVGFMQQFLEVFSELKGKNFYLTGENVCILRPDIDCYSCLFKYAGAYVPCWSPL